MISALVPVKRLAQAKGRLAPLLSQEDRSALALAMLADVVRALGQAERVGEVAVVSADPRVLDEARRLGAVAIEEPTSVRGVNAALAFAARELTARGTEALLVVPTDVPTIAPSEVDGILKALPSPRGIVLVPSVARGTSAIALRPPGAVPFRFGPQSFVAHRREAVAGSVPSRILSIASLATDIDGPQDIVHLLSRPAETETHRALAKMDVVQRLRAFPGQSRPSR
ncbi:MAG: 2-phospho-L-lactate guanylyltransferase [Chloroflexi bacterium]|nr:2-phospho-L-lactate guanylyltransferase [Chloroflexota bacterium]